MPGLEAEIPRYLRNTEEVTIPEISTFSGGELPTWLAGSIISSAPGVFDLEKGSVINWFDGYGILSKFTIDPKENKVLFHSRYLQSNAYKKALEAKRPVLPEFGTPPSTGSGKRFFEKLKPFGAYDCTDNVVGTIFSVGSNLYTAGDTSFQHRIDFETLGTIETYHTLKGYGMNSISSQPLEDENGDVYFIGCSIQPTFRYSVLKTSAKNKDKKLGNKYETICTFPSRWMFGACPCRNFAMTENYIIMIEAPMVLNLMKLAATNMKGYCATDWLDWRPDDGVRFYIIHKKTGQLVKTEIYANQSFISLSVVNAFDDGDEIVVDLISMSNLDVNKATELVPLRTRPDKQEGQKPNLTLATLHRYIIPIKDIHTYPEDKSILKNKSNCYTTVDARRKGEKLIVTPEILTEPGFDFAIINSKYIGKPCSYYGVSGYISNPFSPYAYGIAKFNPDTKKVKMWHTKPGEIPSEPVFVPNPTSISEDDGILLTIVRPERSYNQDNFLVAVNAKTMLEIARANIKKPVAGWYHATFFAANKCLT